MAATDSPLAGIFERMNGGGDPFPMLAALRKSAPVMKLPGDFDKDGR